MVELGRLPLVSQFPQMLIVWSSLAFDQQFGTSVRICGTGNLWLRFAANKPFYSVCSYWYASLLDTSFRLRLATMPLRFAREPLNNHCH